MSSSNHALPAFDKKMGKHSITYLDSNGEQILEEFNESKHIKMFGKDSIDQIKKVFANLPDTFSLPNDIGTEMSKKDLFEDILIQYKKEVFFSDERLYDYLAQYTFNSYIFNIHNHVNVTMFVAPSERGKTVVQEAIFNKIFQPFFGSGSDTSATIRRTIDAGFLPIIDESQASLSQTKSEDHAILTLGTSRNGQINCLRPIKNGADFINVGFKVFSPKFYGARYIPDDDAILNRSFIFRLKKEDPKNFRYLSDPLSENCREHGQLIRNNMSLYRLKRLNGLDDSYSKETLYSSGFFLEGRAQKLFYPLLLEAPSKEVQENIYSLILKQLNDMKKDRENSLESTVLISGYKLLTHPEIQPTCKSIASLSQEWLGCKVAAKTVGKIFRQYEIPTIRTQCGYQVSCSQQDYEAKLKQLDIEVPEIASISKIPGGF